MLINQEVKSALTESGYKWKVEIVIYFKQCWPETITTASKNWDRTPVQENDGAAAFSLDLLSLFNNFPY